jgi:hypothetical protein
MPGLNLRRLTGRALQLSAKAAAIPVLSSGVRLAGRPLLGLDRLRDSRLGDAVPYLTPPPPPGAGPEDSNA